MSQVTPEELGLVPFNPQGMSEKQFLFLIAYYSKQDSAASITIADQSAVDAGTNTTQAVSPNTLANVKTGKTIFVDAGSGTDTRTGLSKYSLLKPFAGPEAAQSAAASGDTIYVRAGTYTTTTLLGKNGVQWFTDPGVSINRTGLVDGAAVFGDGGVAMTFSVFGFGIFTGTTTQGSASVNATIRVSHASSVINIECDTINFSSTAAHAAVAQVNGRLTVKCRKIAMTGASTTGYAVYWAEGEGHITATESIDCGSSSAGLYIFNTLAQDFYLETQDFIGSVQETASHASSATWIICQTHRAPSSGILLTKDGAGRVYITAQKLFGYISPNVGLTYIAAEKISAVNTVPFIQTVGDGESFIAIKHWDVNGQTMPYVMSFGDGDTDALCKIHILGGSLVTGANCGGIGFSDQVGGLVLRFTDFFIDISANAANSAFEDLTNAASLAVLCLNGVIMKTNGTTKYITTGTSQTVKVYSAFSNNGPGTGVTEVIGTTVINAEVG